MNYKKPNNLQFEDLTKKQIDYFWNGVGSQHYCIDPPDFIFGQPSKVHDFLYWLGGDDSDRIVADEIFFQDCMFEITKEKWFVRRVFYYFVLEWYVLVLKILGKKSFEYGKKADSWEELKMRIDTYQDENM